MFGSFQVWACRAAQKRTINKRMWNVQQTAFHLNSLLQLCLRAEVRLHSVENMTLTAPPPLRYELWRSDGDVRRALQRLQQ